MDKIHQQEQLFKKSHAFERTTPKQDQLRQEVHPLQNQELENVLNSISDLNMKRNESMLSSQSRDKQSNNPGRSSITILKGNEIDQGKRAKIQEQR